jgi:hypothetical protein
MHLSCLC